MIDTKKIKAMTKEKIAYDVYQKEGEVMKKKMKYLSFVILGVMVLLGGTITADALSEGAISNKAKEVVKNILNIKVNGEDYNAVCHEQANGMIKCSVDSSVLNDGASFEIETMPEMKDKIEVDVKENEASIKVK